MSNDLEERRLELHFALPQWEIFPRWQSPVDIAVSSISDSRVFARKVRGEVEPSVRLDDIGVDFPVWFRERIFAANPRDVLGQLRSRLAPSEVLQ